MLGFAPVDCKEAATSGWVKARETQGIGVETGEW